MHEAGSSNDPLIHSSNNPDVSPRALCLYGEKALRCGELEDGRGLVGHELDVEAFEGADAHFVGREINVARDLHVEPAALAEIPVAVIAEIDLILIEVRALIVDRHDANPTHRETVEGRPVRTTRHV